MQIGTLGMRRSITVKQNLDDDVLKVWREIQDLLTQLAIKATGNRHMELDDRSLAPLYKAGVLERETFNAISLIRQYGSALINKNKVLPPERTISRFTPDTWRGMPGSVINVSEAQMRGVLNIGKDVVVTLKKALAEAHQPAVQKKVQQAMRAV